MPATIVGPLPRRRGPPAAGASGEVVRVAGYPRRALGPLLRPFHLRDCAGESGAFARRACRVGNVRHTGSTFSPTNNLRRVRSTLTVSRRSPIPRVLTPAGG